MKGGDMRFREEEEAYFQIERRVDQVLAGVTLLLVVLGIGLFACWVFL